MHLSSDCASSSNLHPSCHPTAGMFCWASWTPEEIAQNMFLEEYSGLASSSSSCYSWCRVSTTLPSAYDKVVCPDVRTTIQKLFHGFAYPATYSTVVYSRVHGDILHLFPVPSISGPAYWQWKAIQSAYTAHFSLLLVGKNEQASRQKHDGFHFAQVLLYELMPSGIWK